MTEDVRDKEDRIVGALILLTREMKMEAGGLRRLWLEDLEKVISGEMTIEEFKSEWRTKWGTS